MDKTALNITEKIINKGMQKAECRISDIEKHELAAANGEITLLRTTQEKKITLTGIKNGMKGSLGLNKSEPHIIDESIDQLLKITEASKQDEAHDISPKQPHKVFESQTPNIDYKSMANRIQSLTDYAQRKYPNLNLRDIFVNLVNTKTQYANSNNVNYNSNQGYYTFTALFSSREGEKVSSFNYAGAAAKDLTKNIWELNGMDELLHQSTEQLKSHKIPQKFTGDIIITPHCLSQMIYTFFLKTITNMPLILKKSIFQNKLNEKVLAKGLNISVSPRSQEFAANTYISEDGFETENEQVIQNGILKNFQLSLYGANKTGFKRASSGATDGFIIVDPGDISKNDIIKNTKRGLLLCRFSGGMPNDNTDFSGVAKNSFYIENGEIKYPVSETMIAGNMLQMFNNINAISSERINSGFAIHPWISCGGITIS